MAPRILIAKKKGLSLTVKIPLSAVPRTITGTRKREATPAQAPETDRNEESLRLRALATMPGYQDRDMVEEIEQEKARLEAMEVADQEQQEEPPRPLPEGQERERLLRWALTFQARIPESDWRREERQRMEVVRAIREEMVTDQTDGRTTEIPSEHGTLKSHCSDTSKGSQLSLDGQAEKELEDYLGGDAESVLAGKGETINPQPARTSTPPPTLRRPEPPPPQPTDHPPPQPTDHPPPQPTDHPPPETPTSHQPPQPTTDNSPRNHQQPPTDHPPAPATDHPPPPPTDPPEPQPTDHRPPPPSSRRPQGVEATQAGCL
ncbi:uncharacterized protein LOC131664178 [Phymastichus coffea]|uniref:uncharacterized protein LOC131664178 n=1 Tax=Phymastichus coffea TaxID=108790 RepID=UPI00273AEC1C|nr:uncharacterized protein LOC131664178 [Phymastichus coffea]